MNNAAHCKDVLATCAVQLIVIQKCLVCQMAGTFYFFYYTSSEIHSVDNTAAIPFDLHQLEKTLPTSKRSRSNQTYVVAFNSHDVIISMLFSSTIFGFWFLVQGFSVRLESSQTVQIFV